MTYEYSDRNKHDLCKLRGKICDIKLRKQYLFDVLRLCNLPVVIFKCPTNKSSTGDLEINITYCFTSVGLLEYNGFNIIYT